MTINHNLFTLSSASATMVGPTPRHRGVDITLQNTASVGSVFIGNGDVSSSNYGFRIDPGCGWSIELSIYDTIYATTDINGTKLATFTLNLE